MILHKNMQSHNQRLIKIPVMLKLYFITKTETYKKGGHLIRDFILGLMRKHR